MTPADRRLWLDVQAARYSAAIEADDFDRQGEIWELAAHDPELEETLHAVHIGLADEGTAGVTAAVEDAVAKHLP